MTGYSGIPGNSIDITNTPIVRVPIIDPTLRHGASFFYEDWLLSPSPSWEQVAVFIPEETLVLEVIIDTVIVKPPSIFDDGYEPGDMSPWTPPRR